MTLVADVHPAEGLLQHLEPTLSKVKFLGFPKNTKSDSFKKTRADLQSIANINEENHVQMTPSLTHKI